MNLIIEAYFANTAAQLDHYFQNYVGTARVLLKIGEAEDLGDIRECKTDFIRGMEMTI